MIRCQRALNFTPLLLINSQSIHVDDHTCDDIFQASAIPVHTVEQAVHAACADVASPQDRGPPGQDERPLASHVSDSRRRRRGFRETVQVVSVVLEGAVRMARCHADGVHPQSELAVAVGYGVGRTVILRVMEQSMSSV